jgi:hypothetical protein
MSEASEVKPGSLPFGNSVLFLSFLDPLYRDLRTLFGKAGFDLVPVELQSVKAKLMFPDLVLPSSADLNPDGRRKYQLLDAADPIKGLTIPSESALHHDRSVMESLILKYHINIQGAVNFLFTRCSPAAQESLRTKSDFNQAMIDLDHVAVFQLLILAHTDGPVRTSLTTVHDYLHCCQPPLSLDEWLNLLGRKRTVFHKTFGRAGPDHVGCIDEDKLMKAILFLNIDASHERLVDRLQDARPQATAQEAVAYLQDQSKERPLPLIGKSIGQTRHASSVPSSASFAPRGMDAETYVPAQSLLSISTVSSRPPIPRVPAGALWDRKHCEHCWSKGFIQSHLKKDCAYFRRSAPSIGRMDRKPSSVLPPAPSALSAVVPAVPVLPVTRDQQALDMLHILEHGIQLRNGLLPGGIAPPPGSAPLALAPDTARVFPFGFAASVPLSVLAS